MAKHKQVKIINKTNGFTLIELLAVIIILGVLMIIAIPSVTTYISNSRKSSYVDTAKEIIGAARNLVNSGKLEMFDRDSTYYLPTSCLSMENGSQSPYGEFKEAYVGVIYNGEGYSYYWISADVTGQGVENITLADKLDVDDIVSGIDHLEVYRKVSSTGIGGRKRVLMLQDNCKNWETMTEDASEDISEDGTKASYLYITEDYVFNVGDHIELDGSSNIFDNPQDALNSIKYYRNPEKSFQFFIRAKIEKDVVSEISLGYSLNNQIYYLKGLDSSAYQSNKNTLLESFGDQYCSLHHPDHFDDNGNYVGQIEYINCYIPGNNTNPGLYITSEDNGYLDAFDSVNGNSEWSCMVYNEYSRCTIPY